MILVIRIRGMVEIPKKVQETLFRIRLRRKYAAVLLENTPENQKLLKKVRSYVAFGTINQETLTELIEKRGQAIDKEKKIDAKKIIEGMDKKSLEELKKVGEEIRKN